MRFFVTLLLILTAVNCKAQFTAIPSLSKVKEVYSFADKKLCICNHGAFLLGEDGEIEYLKKNSPLSASDISCGAAEKIGKYFCIGYNSGNIDICVNKNIFTLINISQNNSKINHINCTNTLIFCSYNSGLSIVDVDKKEIKNVCSFPFEVLKSEVNNNKIYAQTTFGVYCLDLNSSVLEDFSKWEKIDNYNFENLEISAEDYNNLVVNTIAEDNISFLSSSNLSGGISLGKHFWSEILKNNVKNIENPDNQNFTCAFYNPYNSSHVFLGSENGTLYEYRNYILKSQYELHNKILSMDCNKDGDLFVLTENNLLIFDHLGVWHDSKLFSEIKYKAMKIIKISDDIFWIILKDYGILAIRFNGTPIDFSDDDIKVFYPQTASNQKIGNYVTDICVDTEGKVWVATDKGICTIQKAENVFQESFSFVKPITTEVSEDLGNYSQYLLSTKHITAIKCDGKSRKWISTFDAGVFVVSSDAQEQVYRFTKDNSGLPSDTVYFMEYCGKTGEVFFSTSCGLASYMTDTQDSQQDLDDVIIYPNPVRKDYQGEIFLSGLENNSDVRITDIAGRLVFKTVSEGGKVSWDGKNLNSNRVATGVYLIFITGLDSKHTIVKKILFIN